MYVYFLSLSLSLSLSYIYTHTNIRNRYSLREKKEVKTRKSFLENYKVDSIPIMLPKFDDLMI